MSNLAIIYLFLCRIHCAGWGERHEAVTSRQPNRAFGEGQIDDRKNTKTHAIKYSIFILCVF